MVESDHIFLAPIQDDSWAVLRREQRRRHVYIIGKTGTGKSTLLFNMMLQDLAQGHGFALLDPHGDLAHAVADSTPTWRTNTVIYLDPADLTHSVGYNPLQNVAPDQRPLVAAHVIAAFKHIWGDSWGPRLQYILENSVRLLLDAPGTTLLGLPRLLIDDPYRDRLLHHCRDPIIRAYFENEFAGYDKAFKVNGISRIANRAMFGPVMRHFNLHSLTRNLEKYAVHISEIHQAAQVAVPEPENTDADSSGDSY